MKVVVNTSPLIALERIGCLHFLRQLYDTVIRPQSVLKELKAGGFQTELNALLSVDLKSSGFHLSDALVSSLLNNAGEQRQQP